MSATIFYDNPINENTFAKLTPWNRYTTENVILAEPVNKFPSL